MNILKFICIQLIVMTNISAQSVSKPVIPVLYHFIYDSTAYEPSYLKYDYNAVKIANNGLNFEFRQLVKFQMVEGFRIHYYTKDLYGIFRNYLYGDESQVKYIIDNWSEKGYLNVFIIKSEDIGEVSLQGFTIVEKGKDFEQMSPKYDNVFINFKTMFDYNNGQVLAHEIGHLFGLMHPFELSQSDQIKQGLLDTETICTNIMNYNCFTTGFTVNQLELMMNNLNNYREYMIK